MMRANRSLGASLVEHNLISIETLESATERLLELMNDEAAETVSLLSILINEQQTVTEVQLLHYQIEEMGLGLIDLSNYDQPDDLRKRLDIGACQATWTIPFDLEEGVHFVASAFYLSPAVRTFWEKQLDTPIQWFATGADNIDDFLRKLSMERENLAAGGKTVETN